MRERNMAENCISEVAIAIQASGTVISTGQRRAFRVEGAASWGLGNGAGDSCPGELICEPLASGKDAFHCVPVFAAFSRNRELRSLDGSSALSPASSSSSRQSATVSRLKKQ